MVILFVSGLMMPIYLVYALPRAIPLPGSLHLMCLAFNPPDLQLHSNIINSKYSGF